MTIKDITAAFDQYQIYGTNVRYAELAGYRVSIDTSNMIHKYMNAKTEPYIRSLELEFDDPDMSVVEDMVVDTVLRVACSMMHSGVTPIFVFDGKTPELKARHAAVKREEDALKKKADYDISWSQVLHHRAQGLKIPYEVKKQVAKNISTRPSKHSIMRLRQILTSLGIPTMQAEYEADNVCARLVEDGIAVAALSEDRDFLTHGCPRLIINYGNGEGRMLQLENVLQSMNMSFNQFRDFCIMLGTDYNSRIYRCGLKTSLERIRAWTSLDNATMDISALNHHEVRRQFQSRPLEELLDPSHAPRIDVYNSDVDEAISLLRSVDLEHMMNAVESAKSQLMMVLQGGCAISLSPQHIC